MLSKMLNRLDKVERKLRRSFGDNITDASARRWSRLHYHIFDHAFLRVFWTNFWQVAPGVYRSNQPTHSRFERYAAMGIKTVINLRGAEKRAHYLFEKESCDALGLTLVDLKLHARRAYPGDSFLAILTALRNAEKPLIFHCKSGADRTSTIAAMYLIAIERQTVSVARKQLGLKYIHLKWTKTGVQDYIIDVYGARNDKSPILLEDWLRDEYDHVEIQRGFNERIPADQVVLPPR